MRGEGIPPTNLPGACSGQIVLILVIFLVLPPGTENDNEYEYEN